MYNDNELYEINIDKLAYSLEHGIDINAREYIYSLEFSIRRNDYVNKKAEIKKSLGEMYDEVVKNKKTKMAEFIKRSQKSGLEGKNLEREVESCFSVVPKDKFINDLLKEIESQNVNKKGATVMTFDVKKAKEVLDQNMMLDCIRCYLMLGLPMLSLPSIIVYGLTSGSGITGTINKVKNGKKKNEYFEVRWNGFTKSAILAKITNGLFFNDLEMNIVPRFKVKG